MRNNFRIISAEMDELHAWLKQEVPLTGVSDTRNMTCLLMTLHNKQIVMAEKLHHGDKAIVVILLQCGHSTPPSIVWPILKHFCSANRTQESEITLVLSGNSTFCRHKLWSNHLSLHSPGKPPVARLLLSFFIRSLIPEDGLIFRILRGLNRRGK